MLFMSLPLNVYGYIFFSVKNIINAKAFGPKAQLASCSSGLYWNVTSSRRHPLMTLNSPSHPALSAPMVVSAT